MEDLRVTRIEKKFSGYGHNDVTVTVTGNLIDELGKEIQVADYELRCKSNNTSATDVYFDDLYDEDIENEDMFYETRYEAAESLIDEVFRKNLIESTYSIETVPSPDEVAELRKGIKVDMQS